MEVLVFQLIEEKDFVILFFILFFVFLILIVFKPEKSG